MMGSPPAGIEQGAGGSDDSLCGHFTPYFRLWQHARAVSPLGTPVLAPRPLLYRESLCRRPVVLAINPRLRWTIRGTAAETSYRSAFALTFCRSSSFDTRGHSWLALGSHAGPRLAIPPRGSIRHFESASETYSSSRYRRQSCWPGP
jgi:hypothetical protein